ncbi:chloride channel protein [Lentisphaera profundi]|uniref:Chloride channel protein n=1 Tax=Lentisphaera profundi TaxID=1658616 RepID=A0ABY7VT92_9BACT|nr:chloride channel protein [Lentisphaera profundi]WDE96979.1 chloride channel protein [Lentisphaera profundi]
MNINKLKFKLQKNKAFKLVMLSILVGIITGLLASLFFLSLEWAKAIIFDGVLGLELTSPPGDHIISEENLHHIKTSLYDQIFSSLPQTLLIILVPGIGCGIAGYIVRRYAPEASYDGTSALVDTFHNKRAKMKISTAIVKGIASIMTLASGGSGGKEGPVAQMGAGFGCYVADKLSLSVKERRSLFLAGCAGGLGAIFRAPLGAAITAVEVLYREDFESESIMPCVIASVTSYSTFMLTFGSHTIFNLGEVESFEGFFHIPSYILLALICSVIGAIYVKFYQATKDFFIKLTIPTWMKPVIGGMLTGVLALMMPYALGDGWGAIQDVMDGKLALGFIALAVIIKIIATSLTIGSGGSAGIFGPSLFIGAMTGGCLGTFLHMQFPDNPMIPSITAFVMVGMAAFFAGVANAPIASIIMVCEITGTYNLLAPLLLTSAFSMLFTSKVSIFKPQVLNKFESPAHKGDMTVNILQEIQVGDALDLSQKTKTVEATTMLGELSEIVQSTEQHIFPVVNKGTLIGIANLDKIRTVMFNQDTYSMLIVADIMEKSVVLKSNMTLYEALGKFLNDGHLELCVVNDENQVINVLRYQDLIEAYHKSVNLHNSEEEDPIHATL